MTKTLPREILGDADHGLEIAEQLRASIIASQNALKPLVLVGAGVSSRAGFPTWGQLMDRLHVYTGQELQKRGGDGAPTAATQRPPKRLLSKQDYLWRAEYYCQQLGKDRFEQFVASLFAQPTTAAAGSGRPAVDKCLEYIVRLPVSHVLTTNYDTGLDAGHRLLRERKGSRLGPCEVINVDNLESTRYFIDTLVSPRRTRYYAHLHGRVDQRDSIVLTESSYRKRYLSNITWARTLYSVFSTRQLVCIGFSATDPDLTAILREISAMGAGVRHFAILGIEDISYAGLERQRLEQKYGITPLLYLLKDPPDSHGNLEAILGWLCEKPGVKLELAARERDKGTASISAIPALLKGKRHSTSNRRYPDDPRRGCFGGKPERNHLRLEASVTPESKDGEWFEVELTVKGIGGARLDPKSQVQFYVHPSFPRPKYSVRPSPDGTATISLLAWGAFTVGVLARRQGSRTPTALELDLAAQEDAPPKFRSR